MLSKAEAEDVGWRSLQWRLLVSEFANFTLWVDGKHWCRRM